MGIIAKGAKCNIEDCDKDGLRSLNTKRVEKAGLRVSTTDKKTEKSKPKSIQNVSVITDKSQANNYIKNAKVITVQDFAKHMGVKISTANSYLKKSLDTGTIKKIGGFSGHFIYQPVAV